MQIQSIKLNTVTPKYYSIPQNLSKSAESNDVSKNPLRKFDAVPFLGISPKFLKAKAYLDSVRPSEGFDKFGTDIYKLDLNKLDGIQDGIKVFDGLNIKELAFILRTVLSTNTVRGCHNMCSHCYADALPPIREAGEYVNKMGWDDFKALTSGFKELYNRLGFYLSAPDIKSSRGSRYIAPFHDSDCIDLVMKDNNGKEHYANELISDLINSTGIKGLFDTTGWTVANKKLQQRAEQFAEFYSKPENYENMRAINISINPFHALYTRSVIERRAGNIEQAEKFKDIYTERITNAIYTFTPLIKTGKLDFVIRAFDPTKANDICKGFTTSDLEILLGEILGKLKQKYLLDLKGNKKYVHSYNEMNSNLKKIKEQMSYQLSGNVSLFGEGRSLKTFGKDNPFYETAQTSINKTNKSVRKMKTVREIIPKDVNGIIDSNGKYYVTNYTSTYPTELQFNFINRNKKTAPIKPALQEDIVITRNVINNI